MTDDNKALNDKAGEEASSDTTPVTEPKATEEVETPEVVEPKEETKSEESKPKKGATKRIRELSSKAKQEKERADSLAETLAEVTDQFGQGATPLPSPPADVEPILKPGEEIDAVEFERRQKARDASVLRQTQAMINYNNRVNEISTRIDKDARRVVSKYPELDPDSDQYMSELSSSITEATVSYVKGNPTGSVSKFVDSLMKPYKKSVDREVGQKQKAVAKQVAEAGMRPTNVHIKKSSADEKSITELEEELGIVQA